MYTYASGSLYVCNVCDRTVIQLTAARPSVSSLSAAPAPPSYRPALPPSPAYISGFLTIDLPIARTQYTSPLSPLPRSPLISLPFLVLLIVWLLLLPSAIFISRLDGKGVRIQGLKARFPLVVMGGRLPEVVELYHLLGGLALDNLGVAQHRISKKRWKGTERGSITMRRALPHLLPSTQHYYVITVRPTIHGSYFKV